MIPNALKLQLQIEFLKRIALLLERGRVDIKTAKMWGSELLSLLPFTSLDDLRQKTQGFVAKYPLMENLTLAITKFEENVSTTKTAQEMAALIKSEKHDEALSLVK